MTDTVIDLFAGPGGWDVGARLLGLDPLGIELDDAACQTRAAAGLRTGQADVAEWLNQHGDIKVWGLIASPPCQTFSTAGKGAGRKALDDVLAAIDEIAEAERPVDLDLDRFDDARTGLVLQPLIYALHYVPEWVAWEQVPPVLPVWEACAEVLCKCGYSVATGTISSEQYGVPQTRKRAVLVASRVREVELPAPTHRKYRKGVGQAEGDPSLRPWVSMAEALGWGMTERAAYTVTGGGTSTGGAEPFGRGSRDGMAREQAGGGVVVMRSNYGTGGDPANRGERLADEPAPTVTGKVDRNRWQMSGGA